MQELIGLGFGLLVGGFVGFNYGVKRVADRAAEAAHDLLEAMRERFGATVRRTVTVEGGEWDDIAEAEFSGIACGHRRPGRRTIQSEVSYG